MGGPREGVTRLGFGLDGWLKCGVRTLSLFLSNE